MGAASSQALDPYRILEDVGEVPFGRAVRAVDRQAGTPVIVLWVEPSRLPAEERDSLVAQARALTRLVQPGLPVVYEVRPEGEELRIVVEPPGEGEVALDCGGLDRRDLIERGTRLLMLLAQAHVSGVLHRHLGPLSVGVNPEGGLTLRGFGLTRLEDDPAWEPPPEVRRGESPSIASDLHAVGHLLAGWGYGVEPPLLGSPAEDPVTAVLARATAEDPRDRYEDAAEMARALTRAAELTAERQTRAMDPEDTQNLSPTPATTLPTPPGLGPRTPSGSSDPGAARVTGEGPAALLERARLLVEAGRTAEAEPLLEELLASGEVPDPVPVLDLLGTLRLQAGRASEAAELLERALALRPDADLHYKLGLALAADGHAEAALEQLRTARELDPGSAEIREALRHLEPGAE